MSKPKHGDEDPDRPGWRWDGNSWRSPEGWENSGLRKAGYNLSKREGKRLYYVKHVPKGPPFSSDEHPDRPGWRWGGNHWYSPEGWENQRLSDSGSRMAEREYDRLYGKEYDDRYGKHVVIHTSDRKTYTREHFKEKQELARYLLYTAGHQCVYCGCSIGFGLEHTSIPSFDRIDTNAGPYYTKDTTQPLCKSCNGMKGELSELQLLEMTNVSDLVKSNIRRYLNGDPRVFKSDGNDETRGKPYDNTGSRHRSQRPDAGGGHYIPSDDSGGD